MVVVQKLRSLIYRSSFLRRLRVLFLLVLGTGIRVVRIGTARRVVAGVFLVVVVVKVRSLRQDAFRPACIVSIVPRRTSTTTVQFVKTGDIQHLLVIFVIFTNV